MIRRGTWRVIGYWSFVVLPLFPRMAAFPYVLLLSVLVGRSTSMPFSSAHRRRPSKSTSRWLRRRKVDSVNPATGTTIPSYQFPDAWIFNKIFHGKRHSSRDIFLRLDLRWSSHANRGWTFLCRFNFDGKASLFYISLIDKYFEFRSDKIYIKRRILESFEKGRRIVRTLGWCLRMTEWNP